MAGDDKFSPDTEAVRALAELLKDTGLSEIEYETKACRIRVVGHQSIAQMSVQPPMAMPMGTVPVPQSVLPASDAGKAQVSSDHRSVKSPMVGMAYLSSAPGNPPFVQVGSEVAEGDTLLIVEAMKVMNPIKAPCAGKIFQICVDDGAPVEFDECLVLIQPV